MTEKQHQKLNTFFLFLQFVLLAVLFFVSFSQEKNATEENQQLQFEKDSLIMIIDKQKKVERDSIIIHFKTEYEKHHDAIDSNDIYSDILFITEYLSSRDSL